MYLNMKCLSLACALLVCHTRRVREQQEKRLAPKSALYGLAGVASQNSSSGLNRMFLALGRDAQFRTHARTRKAKGAVMRDPYSYADSSMQPSHWSDPHDGKRQRHFDTMNARLGVDIGFNHDSIADAPRGGSLKATGGETSRGVIAPTNGFNADPRWDDFEEYGGYPRQGDGRRHGLEQRREREAYYNNAQSQVMARNEDRDYVRARDGSRSGRQMGRQAFDRVSNYRDYSMQREGQHSLSQRASPFNPMRRQRRRMIREQPRQRGIENMKDYQDYPLQRDGWRRERYDDQPRRREFEDRDYFGDDRRLGGQREPYSDLPKRVDFGDRSYYAEDMRFGGQREREPYYNQPTDREFEDRSSFGDERRLGDGRSRRMRQSRPSKRGNTPDLQGFSATKIMKEGLLNIADAVQDFGQAPKRPRRY